MWKNLSVAIAITALMSVGIAGKGLAVSLTESGDAGDSLGTAQAGNEPVGTTLDGINGTIGSGDIDLYQIFISGPSFSASTVGSTGLNTVLYLFNSNGLGVYANDDDFPSLQSTISIGSLAAGTYYLGISISGYEPQSAAGPIFNFAAADPATSANGPGGASPLNSWSSGDFPEAGSYTIGNITGAQFAGAQAAGVPFEFSPTLGVLILAAWGAATKLKSK